MTNSTNNTNDNVKISDFVVGNTYSIKLKDYETSNISTLSREEIEVCVLDLRPPHPYGEVPFLKIRDLRSAHTCLIELGVIEYATPSLGRAKGRVESYIKAYSNN